MLLEQVCDIEDVVEILMKDQQVCWGELCIELCGEQIQVLVMLEFKCFDMIWFKDCFENQVFLILMLQVVDLVYLFLFIFNFGFVVVFQFNLLNGNDELMVGLVLMLVFFLCFICLLDKKFGVFCFVCFESVIVYFQNMLFLGFEVSGYCVFCIVCDSDIEIEEEVEDLIVEFEILFKQCWCGCIVCIYIDFDGFKFLWDFVVWEIGVEIWDIMLFDGMLGMKDLFGLIMND